MNKNPLLALALAASPLLFPLGSAQAIVVSTVPEGYLRYDLPATKSNENYVAHFSFPLNAAPIYSGAVTGVTASTINTSTPVDTNGVLATPEEPYFVQFLSGAQKGRTILITANTGTALTLDTTDNSPQTVSLVGNGFSVVPGDSFEVFPGITLSNFFGDNTAKHPLLLKSSSVSFLSDTIGIYSIPLNRFNSYYFNSPKGWVFTNADIKSGNTIVYPGSAFTINRRQNQPALSFYLMGRVPTAVPLSKTPGNSNLVYISSRYPVDITLNQLSFGSNWTKSQSSFTSDTIGIWSDALNRFTTYFQTADGNWHISGIPSQDVSDTIVPAGVIVSVLKRGIVSSEASYLKSQLPYKLE